MDSLSRTNGLVLSPGSTLFKRVDLNFAIIAASRLKGREDDNHFSGWLSLLVGPVKTPCGNGCCPEGGVISAHNSAERFPQCV